MSFLELVPDRYKFDQFWVEIHNRNGWLIKLRFGAVAMITTLIVGIYLLKSYNSVIYINVLPLWVICALILSYNLLIRFFWKKQHDIPNNGQRFHSIHFSLIQITADFVILLAFMYHTGGVETPMFVFVIFHVIIGSLLLRGQTMYIIVSMTLLIAIIGAVLEYNGVIPHQGIKGFLDNPLYNNVNYIITFFVIFGLALYLSIYLTNSIAHTLYIREHDLSQAYHDLENAEKTKSRYVMTVVHDLKTPIAAAMTYLNMILDGQMGDVNQDLLKPLDRSKVRLTNAVETINDILHISQLRLDSDSSSAEEINLCSVFEEIYAEMMVLFNSKNINFNLACDAKGETHIKADSRLIKLALANLLSNAYKYTDINGKIETRVFDKDGCIYVTVADNGIGIPKNELDKIFQEFFRSTISKRKKIEGTGLGMSLVAGIIHRYGATITVDSPSNIGDEHGPGSVFTIIFPKLV